MPRFAGSVQGVVVQISTKTFRPASAGSINAGSLRKRKLHVDRRTRVLVILNLSFRQRGLILDAPVNGSRAFVDVTTLDEACKHARGFGFVVVRHREVRIVPLAENAESFEIARLVLQRLLRRARGRRGETLETRPSSCLLRTEFSIDIEFDRQTVTVVAGHIWRVVAHHRARFDDEVFQNLVHRRAEMNVGIGVGWTIVKNEFLAARATRSDQAVEIEFVPTSSDARVRFA